MKDFFKALNDVLFVAGCFILAIVGLFTLATFGSSLIPMPIAQF